MSRGGAQQVYGIYSNCINTELDAHFVKGFITFHMLTFIRQLSRMFLSSRHHNLALQTQTRRSATTHQENDTLSDRLAPGT